MSANAERFARRIRARMRALGLRTHDDVQAAGGPSSPILTVVLNARSDELSPSTAKKLETALQLMPGSATISFEDDVDLEPRPAADLVPIEDLEAQVAELQRQIAERRGKSVGRQKRQAQNEDATRPDPEGPELGA